MEKKPVDKRISEEEREKKEELETHKDCYTTVHNQHQYCPEVEDTWCKWKKAEREKDKEMETDTEQEDEEEKE